MIELATIDTPIDSLTLAARNGRVCLLHFGSDGGLVRARLQRWYPSETVELVDNPGGAADPLVRYFGGELDEGTTSRMRH